ncbi:MAG: hypothetical protein VW683_03180 [Betaproteobacteria bacterium]
MDVNIYKQVAERALMTFAQTFLAMFVVTDLTSAKGALTAAAAAGLSVVKSFAATKIGDPSTASVV